MLGATARYIVVFFLHYYSNEHFANAARIRHMVSSSLASKKSKLKTRNPELEAELLAAAAAEFENAGQVGNQSDLRHLPRQKAFEEDNCQAYVMEATQQAMQRVMVFSGDVCGVSDSAVVQKEGSDEMELNEEGRKAICKKDCVENADLQDGCPSFAEVQERCGSSKDLESAAPLLIHHDALNAAWQNCPRSEENIIEASGGAEAGGGEVDGNVESPSGNTSGGSSQTTKHEEPSELKEVKRPKCLGKRILQQRMAYELNAVLTDVTSPSCNALINVFSMFDYKKLGRLTLAEVDGMFDVLSEYNKEEVMTRFRTIADEKGAVPFAKFAENKLGHDKLLTCMHTYATKKSGKSSK